VKVVSTIIIHAICQTLTPYQLCSIYYLQNINFQALAYNIWAKCWVNWHCYRSLA